MLHALGLVTGLVGLLAAPLSAISLQTPAINMPAHVPTDYTAANLPGWAIGPFTRYAGNPIMTPEGSGFESSDVFNPGVIYRNGTFQMLYRGQNAKGYSQIGYASSTNGHQFTRSSSQPVIPNSYANEGCGVEDPRLYELNGTYYSFFTGVHGPCGNGFDINEAQSTDLTNWTQIGPVETGNKDAAVVTNGNDTPVMVNGHYIMYYGQAGNGTYIAYSTDMVHWSTGVPVDLHFPADYTPYEICVGVTDYQTVAGGPINHNIVLFVAGTLMANSRWYYGISEVEFSASSPTQELGQLTNTVLSPSAPYELYGQTPKTVWMNSITFANNQWYMYYGAGDHVIALATAPLRPATSSSPPGTEFTTSFEHGQTMPDWVNSVDASGGGGGSTNVGGYDGLSAPQTAVRQEEAHTGTNALMYSGSAEGQPADYAYTRVFDLSGAPITVGPTTTLSYWIFPQGNTSASPGVSGDNSSCVSLDLVFSDGTALRNLGAVDQNGDPLTPNGQCGHLALDQWDFVSTDVGQVAAGKQITRIDVGYSQPGGSGGYRGYIDDIFVTDQSVAPDPASLVNPLIGSGSSGATDGQVGTFPGADMPFGMVQWSPDTSPDRIDGGGYSYNDAAISGFSLTHLSGPGCTAEGDVPFLPTVGAIAANPAATTETFSHSQEEQASPGYYQVDVGSPSVLSQLTVTDRTGLGEFTYPASTQANMLINLGGSQAGTVAASAQIVGQDEVEGSVTSGHFCGSPGTYTLHFVAQFSQAFSGYGTWTGSSVTPGSRAVASADGGAYVTFDTSTQRTVTAKVGVSYVSTADALQNLESEDPGWDFAGVQQAAHDAWDAALAKIAITGGTFTQQQTFYTALYHALLFPSLFSDVNGAYPGFDGKIHTVANGQDAQYANFSGWDIYRSQIPLLGLIAPSRSGDMVQSLVNDGAQGGWLPRWPAAQDYTGVLSGDSADAIIADAYAMGVRGFDAETALAEMVKGATQQPSASQLGQNWYEQRPELAADLALGYVPNQSPQVTSPVDVGASVTLEYATDDFAIAQLARALGDTATYAQFMPRAQNWQNLFNVATGYVQPRDGSGAFPSGNPTTTEIEGSNGQAGFAEGNAAQYSWQVPQDLHALIAAMGGDAAVVTRLNTFFSQLNAGRTAPYEWAGNEPGFEQPWIYDYAGAPSKTQQVVREIVTTLYGDSPAGEPGNEDLGAMSSWYVWAALGLYPETPGTPVLALASPLFPHASVSLPGGENLNINAQGAAADAPYVQSLSVNGVETQQTWLDATSLLSSSSGATLDFTLGATPDQSWGSSAADSPPSYATGEAPAIAGLSASSVTVAPGGSATVELQAHDATGSPLDAAVTATPPTGLAVDTGSATLAIPADGQASLQLGISAGIDAVPGTYVVPVQLTASGTALPTQKLAVVVATPGSLAGAFDNTGTASDSAQWSSDLDGHGYSYSAQALGAAGLTPGAEIGGVSWPNAPAGAPDNVVADGQKIAVQATPGASTLAVLGAASNGPGSGTLTLTYTDGSTQTATLGLSDWTLNGGSSAPSYGNEIVASMPYRDCTCDATETAFAVVAQSDPVATYVFLASVPLDSTKTLASVTLPSTVSNGSLHVFALGTPPQATVTSVGPSPSGPGKLVTVAGTNFGASQRGGYIQLSDNGTSWGGPGNAPLKIDSWGATAITFTAPSASGTDGQFRLQPGSTASVVVHSANGSVTSGTPLAITGGIDLTNYYDDILVSPDSNPGCSGLNGAYFSADALAANSPAIVAGGAVQVNGFHFTWPDPASCYADDVIAAGQTVLVPPATGATSLGLLGTGVNGGASGTLTVTYSDGTSTSANAGFDDWCGGNLAAGNSRVAQMSYRNNDGGRQNVTCDLFLDTVTGLDPTKTVVSVTLPSPGNANMHIFGLALNAAVPVATISAPSVAATSTEPIGYSVAFNEPVSALTASGVVLGGTADLSGATVEVSQVDSEHFTILVGGLKTDGSGDGTVSVQLPPGAVTDAAGNEGPASNVATMDWSTAPPSTTVTAPSPSTVRSSPIGYSVAFNEPVSSLTASGVVLSGTADLSGATVEVSQVDSEHFTVLVGGLKTDGSGDGTVSVTIAANAVTDSAGVGNAASGTATVDFVIPPAVDAVGPANAAPGQEFTITGSGFGAVQGNSYVEFSDDNTSWGAPGNVASFQVDSWSNTEVVFTVPTPSGPYGQYRVQPGSQASVSITNAAGSSSAVSVGISDTADLADYFNNILVSPDYDQGCAGLNGTYLSSEALQYNTPSFTAGAPVVAGGFAFDWPAAMACQYDNVVAAGQTVLMQPTTGATTLGLLGTGVNGPTSGTLTVHYSDGSTYSTTASFDDWCGGSVAPGNTPLAEMTYRNNAGSQQTVTCTLFLDTLAGLDPSKTVVAVTLPSPGNSNMHLFAIALGIPIVVTSSAATSMTVGEYSSFAVSASSIPTPTLTESGDLPAGVTFTPGPDGTATISGTPAPGTVGKYDVSITASNGVSSPTTQAFTLTVVRQMPAVSVEGSPDPATTGPVTYAVTVSGSDAVPTGLVSVSDGQGGACTIASLSGAGSGSCSIVENASGSPYTVTASYQGDGNFTPATGNTSEVVDKGTPVVVINASPDPVSDGSGPVSYSVSVSGAGAVPTGVVNVSDGEGGGCTVATLGPSGAGSCTITEDVAGSPYAVTATYGGDANYVSASGTVGVTVANCNGSDQECNLSGANLENADLAGGNFTGSNFLKSYLSGVDLAKATLVDANLSGANLTGANLTGADLTGANLGHANLSGANLTGANLTDANLSQADLASATVTGATTTGANFGNVTWSDTTCPDGTNSDADGSTCVGHL